LNGEGKPAEWTDPYVWKAALAFGAGGLIGFLGLPASYALGILLATTLVQAVGLVSLVAILLLCYFIGGAVGGASLRIGFRATLGFGLAFVLGGSMILIQMMPMRGVVGAENTAQVVLGFALVCALAFGVIGVFGAAFAGLGSPRAQQIGAAFAASGAVCGGLFLLYLLLISESPALPFAWNNLLATVALVFVLPMAIGGGFAAKLAKEALAEGD
jgi:hypothetical protein